MKKVIMLIVVSILIMSCSVYTVPPASSGKIMSKEGYSEEILPTGKYRLYGFNKEMIILERGTVTFNEKMKMVMADKLTLTFDVKVRTRIKKDKKVLNSMFNDISPKDNVIDMNMVYKTYGRMVVRNDSRKVVSIYSVEDVHTNYAKINGELFKMISESLSATPLQVSDVTIGEIIYPEAITRSVELAKQRELQIKEEEATAQVLITKAKGELAVAEAQRAVALIRATTIRDENRITAEGLNELLLKYRQLEVMEQFVKSDKDNIIYIPYEAFSSIGVQTKMYNK